MTNTKEALNRFRSLLDWVDDLSAFVTGVMRQFDGRKESGQRSEIELGLEHWMNPPEKKP